MREISPQRALVNAILATAVIALGVWGAMFVARRHWQWQPTFRATAQFPRVSGLAIGDKVHLQGMDAGVVESIKPPPAPGKPIQVVLKIDARLHPLIRSDAIASIATNGVVGPKIVEIIPGSPDAPPLPDGGALAAESPIELADLLHDARTAMKRLEEVASTAETGLSEINGIAASINRGEGTLGKLVRDDAAYTQVLELAERGQRTVEALDDNLSAVKGLWPIAGYFKDRGYDEPERVLYRPNATREARVLSSDELFQDNSAIITAAGHTLLDEFARWFKARRWPDAAEFVIAAFTDTGTGDEDKARILTQDQARAVKSYLEQKHKLFEIPVFRQRKVAAVGYGSRTPRPDPNAGSPPAEDPPPSRRVELLLFTPKS
jgi:phospholipid/cholesterol/gamma-HCH transport system substrate-binding protein